MKVLTAGVVVKVTSVCEEIFSFSRAMVWVLLDTPGAALLENSILREQQLISAQGLDSRRAFVDVPSLGNSRVENTRNE
jgi:hypothetical protein